MFEYFLFFLGIVILGDMMVIPLVYFAVSNSLSLPAVITVGLLGSTVADCVWYWMGRSFRQESINKLFKIEKVKLKHPEFFSSFTEKADRMVFLSKFIFGLRVPIRILYGMENLSFKTFIKINIIGSIIWLLLISGLAFTLNMSAEELKLFVIRGEIIFLIFFTLIMFFEIWAKKYLKNILKTRSGSSQTEPPQQQLPH